MNPALIDLRNVADAGATRRATPLLAASPSRARSSWWLWPHLLSLDAPLVALVWQRWWAHAVGLALPGSREGILGLGVWLIYLADRLADTAGDAPDGTRAIRHRFSRRHRDLLMPLAFGIALTLVALSFYGLPRREFRAGLGLLGVALAYFWLIHGRLGRGWAAYLPKEAVVGAMFGAGTLFFVVCGAPDLSPAFWVAGFLFAAVCFLNCALITQWERQARDLDEQSSLLNAFPRFSTHLRAACLVLAGTALVFSSTMASCLACPVALSALLLAALDGCKSRLSVETLRVSADLVLLSPAFVWIALRP